MLPEAIVFCDGSSSPKSKQGGWAAIVLTPSCFVELCGWSENTTNNRMELLAAIHGLKELEEPHKVQLISDSAYVLNAIHNKWYNRWFADEAFFDNAFAKALGRPVPRPNMDLWRVISTLDEFHEIETVKVKGHSNTQGVKSEFNDKVDKLAVYARKNQAAYRRELPNGYQDEEEKSLHQFTQMIARSSGVLVPEHKVQQKLEDANSSAQS
jgi:ribonuclease HI